MEAVVEHERRLRAMVREEIGDDSIRSFRVLDISYTLRDAVIIWCLLATPIALVIGLHGALGPWAIVAAPLAALIAGVAFNWINVQIHEASHHFLLPNKKWNDIYCNLALGAWALQDVETYRATHGMHHAHLHGDRDPDLWVYTQRVGSLGELLRGIAEDLLLLAAPQRVRQVAAFVKASGVVVSMPRYVPIAKIAAQAVVLGAFVYGCGAWGVVYYGAYLYGLLGVFPVLVRIRTVVQHYDEALPQGAYVSRTTVAPFVEFVLVGARMDYHFEHHLFPTIPYYNLRKMHDALHASGFFDTLELRLRTDDYLKTYGTLAA